MLGNTRLRHLCRQPNSSYSSSRPHAHLPKPVPSLPRTTHTTPTCSSATRFGVMPAAELPFLPPAAAAAAATACRTPSSPSYCCSSCTAVFGPMPATPYTAQHGKDGAPSALFSSHHSSFHHSRSCPWQVLRSMTYTGPQPAANWLTYHGTATELAVYLYTSVHPASPPIASSSPRRSTFWSSRDERQPTRQLVRRDPS